jgi:hypothetical protein
MEQEHGQDELLSRSAKVQVAVTRLHPQCTEDPVPHATSRVVASWRRSGTATNARVHHTSFLSSSEWRPSPPAPGSSPAATT